MDGLVGNRGDNGSVEDFTGSSHEKAIMAVIKSAHRWLSP